MRLHVHRSPASDRARATTRTRTRVVCYRCEHEWDADKRPADADCYVCGAQSGSEDHVVIARRAP